MWLSRVLVLVAAAGCAAAATQPLTVPVAIAHRGDSGHAPEETEKAYRLAARAGADWLEMDVEPTKDGVLVLRHDPDLNRSTNAHEAAWMRGGESERCLPVFWGGYGRRTVCERGYFVYDYTWEEVSRLEAVQAFESRNGTAAGQRVLRLDEALALVAGLAEETGRAVGAYVETKLPEYVREQTGVDVEARVLDALEAAGFVGPPQERRRVLAPFMLQSFERGSLERFRAAGVPAENLVMLVGGGGDSWVDASTNRTFRSYFGTDEAMADLRRTAATLGVAKHLVLPRHENGTVGPAATDLVERAHAASVAVHAWTFRSDPQFQAPQYATPDDEYRQYLAAGVDGVFSDFPGEAVAARNSYADFASQSFARADAGECDGGGGGGSGGGGGGPSALAATLALLAAAAVGAGAAALATRGARAWREKRGVSGAATHERLREEDGERDGDHPSAGVEMSSASADT